MLEFPILKHRSGVFPNTWVASLASLLWGGYQHGFFLAFMPPAFVLACLFPQATSIFQLKTNPGPRNHESYFAS
jgi:hypothetical protein